MLNEEDTYKNVIAYCCMKNKKDLIKSLNIWYLIIFLWVIGCFVFFNWFYRYHFFCQEQNQLFLWSSDYLVTYFRKPAWLAVMTGDFLTQFYYYIFAGPVILTLSLLGIGHFMRLDLDKIGLRKVSFPIAIIVMTIELVLCFKVEYRLDSVIALLGGCIIFYIVPISKYRKFYMWIGVPLSFWLFGYGAFAYTVFALITVFRDKGRNATLIGASTVLLAILLLLLTKKMYYLDYDKLLSYPGMGQFVSPDFILERDLVVDNEYNWGHYNKVINVVEETPAEQRTNEMTFFYNLAQAQMGVLPDNLLRLRPTDLGTFSGLGPETPIIVKKNINELYFILGDMTFTERAAMIGCVSSNNNRNVRMIKRLAECNIVNCDTTAAMKYIRILKKTFVYRKWAEDHDISKGKINDDKLLAKRQFVNRTDTIRFNDFSRTIMLELLNSNVNNTVALDYLLCSDLLAKDIKSFKSDYDKYCMATHKERLKPIYQQALMIWLAATNSPDSEWNKYIHDKQTLARFAEYNNQRMSNLFSDTYWYYYDTTKI